MKENELIKHIIKILLIILGVTIVILVSKYEKNIGLVDNIEKTLEYILVFIILYLKEILEIIQVILLVIIYRKVASLKN